MSKNYQTSTINVLSYDESDDTFLVRIKAGSNITRTNIASTALALIVGEFNEPDQFIGNSYSLVAGM